MHCERRQVRLKAWTKISSGTTLITVGASLAIHVVETAAVARAASYGGDFDARSGSLLTAWAATHEATFVAATVSFVMPLVPRSR